MICLNDEIKKKLKLKYFNKVFQITNIKEFEIYSRKNEIEISLRNFYWL